MFGKILIANRGEIALRILRACHEMGISTVAVHSTADENAMHVRLANESVCIGPPNSRQSYLNIPSILAACDLTSPDAVHPGYGFLAENAAFARIVGEHGFTFIGPRPEHIELMGNKIAARRTVAQAGLPCVPGSEVPVEDPDEARKLARDIGYPVLIKAAAGGGGRGMKIAQDDDSLGDAILIARAEASAAFGDDTVYIEKLIEYPRHIEIQLLADSHGAAIHLGERDCSLQRRHQKILEEAPSPALNSEERNQVGTAAVEAIRTIGYLGAGTVEFLYADGEFHFIEMNTRLQVEHPVTEEVYGVDIVREQIRIANGGRLSFTQEEMVPQRHAIECRINAENPETFLPSPGRIDQFHSPGGLGVRLDSAVYQGYSIPPFYDSLIGKLIVAGRNREEALMRLRRALEEMVVSGIDTTIPLFRKLLERRDFLNGDYHIRSLEEWIGDPAEADGT